MLAHVLAAFLLLSSSVVPGQEAVAIAKEKLAGREQDPSARHDYAKALAAAGRNEEALAEYLWCFDHGDDDPAFGYATVRLSILLSDVGRLGRIHPPAIRALEDRRDRAEAAVLSGKGSERDAADAAALNRQLGSPERCLAMYEKLAKENRLEPPVLRALLPEVAEPLVAARRYAELVGLAGDVVKRVNGEIESSERRPKHAPGGDEQVMRMMEDVEATFREMNVRKLSVWYEALLGAGRREAADTVAERLIRYAPRGSTYANLIDRALHAESAEAARALAERGRKSLADREKVALEAAAKKVPAAK